MNNQDICIPSNLSFFKGSLPWLFSKSKVVVVASSLFTVIYVSRLAIMDHELDDNLSKLKLMC